MKKANPLLHTVWASTEGKKTWLPSSYTVSLPVAKLSLDSPDMKGIRKPKCTHASTHATRGNVSVRGRVPKGFARACS